MSHEPITLAAITGAHGVAGEVRLKLLGDGLESLKSHRHYNDGALTLQKIRSVTAVDTLRHAAEEFLEKIAGQLSAEAVQGWSE